MPQTSNFGFEFETPQTKPGITLTGDQDGSAPILAEQVDAALAAFEARLSALETTGFRYLTTIYFTADGTFTKSSFTGFRGARIRMVGGGGGGGGANNTTTTTWSAGGGGGGGAYAESFLTDTQVPATVSVTVGAGGAGGMGLTQPGTAGGTSSFGTLVSAEGGDGGLVEENTGEGGVVGGSGGSTATGDLVVVGGDGFDAKAATDTVITGNPDGGSSMFGMMQGASSTTGGANGSNAPGFGNGGSGAQNDENEADDRTGGNGGAGIVIVDVFV